MPHPHILFRFHKFFDVCEQNLRLLRKMAPGLPVHGLFGGQGGIEALPPALASMFDTLFALPFEDPYYNWMHGDICVRWWFKQQGHHHDFSHLCVAEWDMIYLKPLIQVYGGFPDGANQQAISNTYENLLVDGWPWIQGRFKNAFDTLVRELNKEKSLDPKALFYGIFGGCVLCRPFLELFAQKIVPSYSNDEVRLALYAALFGIPVIDCGFLTDKRNIVNASSGEYGEKEIAETLAKGGQVVHPIRILIEEIENKILQSPA